MMRSTLALIASLMTEGERRRALIVLLMAAGMALLEAAGVVSVMPFLAVAGNPEVIHRVAALDWLYRTFQFESSGSFLVALGLCAIVVLVLGSAYKLATEFVMTRFIARRRHSISRRLLGGYLAQPFAFYLTRNSSDLAKGILSETDIVANTVLKPFAYMVAHGLVVVIVVALLISLEPVTALVVAGTLGGAYALIFAVIRRFVLEQGAERTAANRARFKAVHEALSGIKEIKLRWSEPFFLRRFDDPSNRFALLQADAAFLAIAPKYVLEAVAITVVVIVAILMILRNDDLGSILPVLGAYAVAGYRLLPSLQHVYSGATNVRFGFPALESIASELKWALEQTDAATTPPEPCDALQRGITLADVSFTYPAAPRASINHLDLVIRANTTVAFVGATGAGKTTAVDLILGLLTPTGGRVLVDDIPLTSRNLRAWQRRIGYVPQMIYLADDTLRANIAFGLPPGEIDDGAVERAARAAQLHEFIEATFPDAYRTQVGERGIRLSGGQRQRLGIARALYYDPDVLVLDEGTSSLDTATEAAVMESIRALSHRKTIILIAHRLTTVSLCDEIFVLRDGMLADQGTYEQLLATSSAFRQLAGAPTDPTATPQG